MDLRISALGRYFRLYVQRIELGDVLGEIVAQRAGNRGGTAIRGSFSKRQMPDFLSTPILCREL